MKNLIKATLLGTLILFLSGCMSIDVHTVISSPEPGEETGKISVSYQVAINKTLYSEKVGVEETALKEYILTTILPKATSTPENYTLEETPTNIIISSETSGTYSSQGVKLDDNFGLHLDVKLVAEKTVEFKFDVKQYLKNNSFSMVDLGTTYTGFNVSVAFPGAVNTNNSNGVLGEDNTVTWDMDQIIDVNGMLVSEGDAEERDSWELLLLFIPVVILVLVLTLYVIAFPRKTN